MLGLQKVPPVRAAFPLCQLTRIHFSRTHSSALLAIASAILPSHPQAQCDYDHNAHPIAAAGGHQRGDIPRQSVVSTYQVVELTYFGAYCVRNVAALKIPAKLPNPTKKPVLAAREFSCILLLLCHACTKHDGIYDPAAMRKHAKYATPLWLRTSIVARMTIPTSDITSENTMWKVRSRKWSDDLATQRSTTAPTRFGATVQRFVLTVEKPSRSTICSVSCLLWQ